MQPTLLITGATGTVGARVLQRLAGTRDALRVFVRDPAKLDRCLAARLEVVTGDLSDVVALERALAAVTRLFVLTKPGPGQAGMERAIFACARRARVEGVVRVSVIGADPASASSVRRWHGEAERALAESGIPHALLRCNFFMQNLLAFARGIAAKSAFALPAGEARISMIDAADIADAAAAALISHDPVRGTFDLTGPESLSFAEVARALSQAAGRQIAYRDSSLDAFRERLVSGGQPAWYAQAMAELYEDFRAGINAPVARDIERLAGRPARSFIEFARAHARAWTGE